MYKEIFDRLASEFSTDRYQCEYESAKSDYVTLVGRFFDDEPDYEAHITGFLEWYLFDRPLYDSGLPPVRLFYAKNIGAICDHDQELLRMFERSRRSVFEVRSVNESALSVKDLLSIESPLWVECPHPVGFVKGHIIDARRFMRTDGSFFFSESLWLHAKEARDSILQFIENGHTSDLEDQRSSVVKDLAYMHWRHVRFAQAPVKEVYNRNALIELRAKSRRQETDAQTP